MRVLISGSSGLVGTALCKSLVQEGHEIVSLVRRQSKSPREVSWDPSAGTIETSRLAGFDAVVHLAGENIAAGRWTESLKRKIRDSRVEGTKLLAGAIAGQQDRPLVWVGASAIGYYGDRGEELLTEDSPPGKGFLADVCKEWEAAARPVCEAGVRTALLRIGVVLSTKGGALAQMLTPFRLGLGGVIGPGTQYMSWIDLADLVGVIRHALDEKACEGPLNAAAPQAVTNAQFTKAMGKVLSRPTLLPMPAFAARLAFGQMADELLLASTRVSAEKIQQAGYVFRYPAIESALRHQLER